MNARFWLWRNSGWVKLTLHPGQRIVLSAAGRTEEGWYSESQSYYHDGAGIQAEWSEDGSDCDGRLSSGGQSYCPLEHLNARNMMEINPTYDNWGIFAPEWEPADRWQRDYVAEACGY